MCSSFFPKEKLIHSHYIFPYYIQLYPHFNHLLHTVIKRNIAYTQIDIVKWKKCSLVALGIFIAKL